MSIKSVLTGAVVLLLVFSVFHHKKDGTLEQKVTIPGAVVPHHDIVGDLRAQFLQELKEKVAPETIILVSPNHFGTGAFPVSVYDEVLTTVHGELQPNREVMSALSLAGYTPNTDSFRFEHGIRSPLADIAQAFQGVRIVPIIIKTDVSYEEMVRLGEVLHDACKKCLLIASVDFSHYQTAQVAALHDVVSVRELSNGEPKYVFDAPEVDSPQTLALLALWSKAHGAPSFQMVHHTNSGDILPQYAGETTTHVMGYYSDAQVAALLPGATFMIADSRLRELSKDEPGRAEFWERLFWGVDSAFLHARIGGCIPLTGTRNAKQAAIITVAYDSSEDWAETVAMVRENRDASVPVVVCASWGDFDTNIREEIAHAFIDAGAALVLGEVKDTESSVTIHKDRPIFSIATTVRKGEATILSGILTPDRLSVSQSVVRATSTYDVTSDQKEGEVFWAPMSEYRDSEREGEWYTFPRTIH